MLSVRAPKKRLVSLLAAVGLLVSPMLAAAAQGQEADPPANRPQAEGPKNGNGADKIKEYGDVITEEAVSAEGVFKTHRIGDKLYYEIGTEILGQPFVWVTQIARTQTSYGYGGLQAQNRVVRWDKRGDRVLLRNVEFDLRADDGTRERVAVDASSLAAIIKAFDVTAYAEDGAAVIDVTGLFTDDVTEFSPKTQLRDVQRIDKSRTFIESVKTFPRNIETRVIATFSRTPRDPFAPPPTRPQRGRPAPRRSDPSLGSVTVELHHSMVRLPDDPMMPRLWDQRVGFFSEGFEDYSSEDHEVENVRYITRWRLDKKNPDARMSDPVQPIVYYLGRGIPERWRPYIKQGVEDWQVAFEAAGFSNAIIARDAPSAEEDPDWDAEDARYSTIRWLPSTIQNAFGPHVHDPRTGEIVESDIRFYHNVVQLARNWYFAQVSPSDPRAQDLPLPDDLVGELMRYVAAHEVGHTLGYPHNMKASSCYSVAQLRSREFTEANGNEASIMDYGRFNYVAQPGDGARLIPMIGPYDKFVTEWGYAPIPRASTPAQEKPALDAIAARQLDDACLLFGSPGIDPSAQTEDLSGDAIEATRLGLANLDRVAGYLVTATGEPGEDYSLLSTMHGVLISQRDRELGHVAGQVGGVIVENKVYGQAADVYVPVPRERQAAAVQFLLDNAFEVPASLVTEDILGRIGMTGVVARFAQSQRRILGTLYNANRIQRMVDLEATSSDAAYTVADLSGDLADGIFRELGSRVPRVNPYRRNLQRAFVELLVSKIAGEDAVSNDLRAAARGVLAGLAGRIEGAAPSAADQTSRYHLQDLAQTIRAALDAAYTVGS